jgi:hypothetical protein
MKVVMMEDVAIRLHGCVHPISDGWDMITQQRPTGSGWKDEGLQHTQYPDGQIRLEKK